MATKQLQVMVKNLRAEVGHALSTAQGVNQLETLKYLLERTQEELWTAFVWPELRNYSTAIMAANQETYPFGSGGFDTIRQAFFAMPGATSWTEIEYGIGEDKIAANGFNNAKGDPVQAWDIVSPTLFRVWPTPVTANGQVRFKCQQQLGDLIADADNSTLDGTLIVLFAAAEILARAKSEDAPGKAQKAQRHLLKLLGNKISRKNKVSTIGSGSPNRGFHNGIIRVGG